MSWKEKKKEKKNHKGLQVKNPNFYGKCLLTKTVDSKRYDINELRKLKIGKKTQQINK